MKALRIIAVLMIVSGGVLPAHSQLQNGAIAPDFTLTDITGTQHTLYEYLDAGKTVYVDFFACHCPFCWAYHSTQALSDLYDMYGPATGPDDVFVMAIEYDPNNSTDQFYGIGSNTQGDWVTGTNYPYFNPEGSIRSQIISDYQVNYYPLIYAICPDRSITVIGTQSTEDLYAHQSTCPILELAPIAYPDLFHYVQTDIYIEITVEESAQGSTLSIVDLSGNIRTSVPVTDAQLLVDISTLESGLYFLRFEDLRGQVKTHRFLKLH